MTTSSSVSSLLFFCLLILLPAQHAAASSHASYKLGSTHVFFKTPGKSSGNSQQASTEPPATTCSSIATGLGNNKLPVVHRQSPCSPLHGRPSLTTADVLRRDTHLIHRRFASRSATVAAPSPAPAAATIPTNGSPDTVTPSALDYSVLISYGTPEQQLPMFLDNTLAASLLRCKPCASGSQDCDPAFDTSQSSTFAHVPCGSPECPTNCSGTTCPFAIPHSNIKGLFARDVLTLAPSSTAVPDFKFICLDVDGPSDDMPEAGSLDLSRGRNSLPSQLSLSSQPAFSYCLPQFPDSPGFLSLGSGTIVGDDSRTAPLLSNVDQPNMYFIDLVGMSLGGNDLPLPAGTFRNASTNLDLGTTFTMLPPVVYTALSKAFEEQMSQYNHIHSLPNGFAGFDACYNFTGLTGLLMPLVQLKFGNGDIISIDSDQMLYYDNPAARPFTVSCLAFTGLVGPDDDGEAITVIGTYTLATTEVVFDVAGGKVGFIPRSC